MLGLASVASLSAVVGRRPRELYRLADHAGDYIRHYELSNPSSPRKKPRPVLAAIGPLRSLHADLLHKLFRPRLRPSPYSYGGVPGRNAVMGAHRHLGSAFVYTTDIAEFFPSISFWDVRSMFEHTLGCGPEVARLLADLCTFDGGLAQGLVTSPVLADCSVRPIDARISGLCKQHQLVYTRFVDDLAISGWFRLNRHASGIVALIRRIVAEAGFKLATLKEQDGDLGGGDITLTGLRFVDGRLDVAAEYLRRLEQRLEEHRLLGAGGPFDGLLFTRDQLAGQVEYVCAINRNRRRRLRQKLSAIDWVAAASAAEQRGLMVCRTVLRPASASTG